MTAGVKLTIFLQETFSLNKERKNLKMIFIPKP